MSSMPIKTLHITNAWHSASGGIGTFYRALFEAANRAGRPLRMIVPGERSGVEEIGDHVRIYSVAAAPAPFFDRRYRLLLPPSYLPLFAGEIPGILRRERPDLIEICDKYSVSWLAGLLRRGWLRDIPRPVLAGLSCERMDDNVGAFLSRSEAGRRWSRFYLGNLYLPLFDYHIANSSYTAEELREAMRPAHERQLYVRPMGAEIDDFGGAERSPAGRAGLVAKTGGGAQTRLLLYAGRISPEKNPGLLLETMERLRDEDCRLLVAGAGPLTDWFAAEAARRAPGRVTLLGHIGSRAELLALYSNCDAFVHPNPREPFGIAPLEAMAAGLPLIAPAAGGVTSYASPENAWLAPAEAEAFAARFFALYDEMHENFPRLRFAPRPWPSPHIVAEDS